MTKRIVLTMIAPDKPGLVERVSETIVAHNGSWLASRMSHLAGMFAGILSVSVHEDQVEKLALHGPIADFVRAFVAVHFKPEPFKKRKRDKARGARTDTASGPRVAQGDAFRAPTSRRKGQNYH